MICLIWKSKAIQLDICTDSGLRFFALPLSMPRVFICEDTDNGSFDKKLSLTQTYSSIPPPPKPSFYPPKPSVIADGLMLR